MSHDCPVCAGPLAWSHDRRLLWCAVYGTHPDTPVAGRPHPAVDAVVELDYGTPPAPLHIITAA